MSESVPVRCPACRCEQSFTPPTYPCPCGAPLTLPVVRGGAPEEIEHRTWHDAWVPVRCPSCGRRDDWPQPELGCACGAVVRVPVIPAPSRPDDGPPSQRTEETPEPAAAPAGGPPGCVAPRPAFRPVTIRTARDAVTAASQYLKWIGFTGAQQTRGQSPLPFGVDLRGEGVVARVDPRTHPTGLRDVECLWLNGLNESALPVFFALAGYARDARARADSLGVPLFVMDLTGTPQPVNDPADDLVRSGPPLR